MAAERDRGFALLFRSYLKFTQGIVAGGGKIPAIGNLAQELRSSRAGFKNMIITVLPTGDSHGWGICGTNLNKELAKLTVTMPLSITQDLPTSFKEPVLHAVSGPTFLPSNPSVWSTTRNVGLAFIEDMDTAAKYVQNAFRYYDHIICGSTWCAEELAKLGISTSVAIQGVDSELFYPIENKPKNKRFNIGSFGKFEYRKGQDIVIAAYAKLHRQYPDIHLIAGWGNLWPETMNSMVKSEHIRYTAASLTAGWRENIEYNMKREGIPRDRYTLLDMMPHHEMPFTYHRCDVAVFPNRVEAGTNMPLMECASCGIPIVTSIVTGHSDVAPHKISSIMCYQDIPTTEEMRQSISEYKRFLPLENSYTNPMPSWANTAKSVLDAVNNKELKHDNGR